MNFGTNLCKESLAPQKIINCESAPGKRSPPVRAPPSKFKRIGSQFYSTKQILTNWFHGPGKHSPPVTATLNLLAPMKAKQTRLVSYIVPPSSATFLKNGQIWTYEYVHMDIFHQPAADHGVRFSFGPSDYGF